MSVTELTQDEQDFEAAFESRYKKADTPKEEPKADAKGEDEAESEQAQEASEQEAEVQQEQQAEPDTVESLRAQLKELAHQERSSAGRVSVFMREAEQLKGRVAALERENADLKAKLSSQKPAPKEGDQAPEDSPNDVLENAPELKASVERRIQRAIEEATRGLRTELDAANAKLAEVGQTASEAAQRVEPLASREAAREVESVRAQLDKLYPKWRADVASGEVQRWLEGQHESIKAMFPGKGLGDSSTVLKLFYADKGAVKPQSGEGAASEDRLLKAAGIVPRPAARTAPDVNDFEGAFAEFAAKRQR